MPSMKKIHLHDKTFKSFIPEERIEKAIDGVAAKINADYEGTGTVPVAAFAPLSGWCSAWPS